MSWQLMVIGQLSIALLGSCAALGWYIVKLRRANAGLFQALESIRAEQPEGADQAPGREPADAGSEPAEQTVAEAAPEQEQDPEPEPDPEQAGTEPGAVAGLDSGLKVLLQQFTQDSRDMMGRIEQLEAQTLQLIATAQQQAALEQEAAAEPEAAVEPEAPALAEAGNQATARING